MYNSDHMSGTDWIGTGFMMAFLVIVLLVAIWAITQWTRTADRSLPADKSARDIVTLSASVLKSKRGVQ